MSDAVLTEPAALDAPRPRRGAAIAGLGIAVPEAVVTNEPIAARLGVTEDWIVARTGVRERHVAAPGEGVAELGAAAAARALDAARIDASQIDLLLVATMSHDELIPAAGPLIAERIGARGAGALDLNAACSGFVSALALAAGQIESGRAGTVLVVGSDVITRLTDPDDRSTAALFGDGAGAVVVTESAGEGRVGPAILGADGSARDFIRCSRSEALVRMKGHETFKRAVDQLASATLDAVAASGRRLDEIDVFAYHQANARILAAVADRLDLDRSRVIDCIGAYANTSAATIPLALAEAQEAGLLRDGNSVLLAAFGGGLTWAAAVVEWGAGEPTDEEGADG